MGWPAEAKEGGCPRADTVLVSAPKLALPRVPPPTFLVQPRDSISCPTWISRQQCPFAPGQLGRGRGGSVPPGLPATPIGFLLHLGPVSSGLCLP